jgi:hypothetical protein
VDEQLAVPPLGEYLDSLTAQKTGRLSSSRAGTEIKEFC